MPASDVAAPAPDASATVEALPEQRLQRILKFIVVTLAILLFAGLLAAVARVIYLASAPVTQPVAAGATPAPTSGTTPAPTPAIRPEQSLALPAGAQVRSVSLSGNRLPFIMMSARPPASRFSTCRRGVRSQTSSLRLSQRAARRDRAARSGPRMSR